MKIGVLSDTHGVIHPKVFSLMEGADLILHAGDVGSEEVLTELSAIAPLVAVTGNTDVYPVTSRCRAQEVVEAGGKRIYLTHRLIEGGRYLSGPLAKAREAEPHVVVFGHTHLTHAEESEGILFFNPGPAGVPRPGTRLAAGILKIAEDGITHTHHYLE